MSATAPSTMKALKIRGPGKVTVAESCPIPQPQDDEILVRVVCVTLNPVDWKSADLSPTVGATWGIDYSGEVVKVGSAVKRPFILGDGVCGGVFGNNPDEPNNGAFAEYVVVPGDLVFKIPESMSFEKAATLGIGLSTVGLALYQLMKLPFPDSPASKSQFVLVHGGGTATGTLAIQLLRMSGMQPVTTCSPHNFSQVKALGAVEAFDYHSPSCASDISAYTKSSLELALDCITNSGSMKICYTAIGPKGGRYIALDPFPIRGHTRRSIKPSWVLTFTITGKPVNWQEPFRRDARPQDRVFAEKWYRVAQQLLDEGAIMTHPVEEVPGGLAGIIKGADRGRKGLVSGVKLVYRISDGS